MATGQREIQQARERAARACTEIGRGLRLARRSAGLSQRLVAARVGIWQPKLSKIERGFVQADLVTLSGIAAVVGLDLAAKLHPAGPPVRDAGHIRMLTRLQRLLPTTYRRTTEIPIPIPGDARAIDAMLAEPRIDVGFELESVLLDAQALVRRTLLKQRDSGLPCMVIVLSDTPANRDAAYAAEAALRASFPLGGRAVLAALRAGKPPPANGIIFV